MKAYNLAGLEQNLHGQGWTVTANDYVIPQDMPGQVDVGGYSVVLTAPSAETFTGDGPTRSEAFRAGARVAGLIKPDDPHLV